MKRISILALTFILFNFENILFACATCYGDPTANTTKALNIAILSMIGVTGTMLSSVATYFFYLKKRAKNLKTKK